MIVSWNWLTDYLRLDMPVEALAERLALTGLNHETTEEVGGDLAIDLEVTSNRPDCLGHLGVAREVGVVFGLPVRYPDPRPATSGPPIETLATVRVDEAGLCPRFTARVVSGVKVGPSPIWLRRRLETIGVRPISNVVDATNYVMFECGQPLHAYDLGRLAGRELIVRRARAGETLLAINNKTYELTDSMLAIADGERPVGLAGVMGGLMTEVGEATTDVLIEAARFDPASIRRTARALGLFSPASYRFERTVDPEIADWASRRCADLILATAGGTLRPGLIDVDSPRPPRAPISLRFGQIARILGIDVDRGEVMRILQSLGVRHDGGDDLAPRFVPPSWRSDLEREIDLIEEVARIHGYESIPEDRPVPLTVAPRSPRERVEAEVRGTLIGIGFDEAVTYSLVGDELAVPLGPEPDVPPIWVDHSSRRREGALRRSLVPSLLNVRRQNEAHGNLEVDVFEIADVYLPRPGEDLPEQPTRIGLVSGRDFLGLKGVVEALLDRFHALGGLESRPIDLPLFAAGRGAELLVGGQRLGFVGEVDPARAKGFDLRGPCSAAELSLEVIEETATLVPRHVATPPYPAVHRDLSLMVAESLSWAELAGAVARAGGPMLESVTYLDTFQGGTLPPGRQSVHFGLQFRNPGRTMTGEEVESLVKVIVDDCVSRFDATLRR